MIPRKTPQYKRGYGGGTYGLIDSLIKGITASAECFCPEKGRRRGEEVGKELGE